MREILIAGTVYEAVPVSTLGHDLFMQQVLADNDLLSLLTPGEEGDKEERAKEFQRRIATSGCAPKLMAGLLQKKGVPWNPADAAEAEKVFGTTTSPHDKALLILSLGEALAHFFRSARRSLLTSR